MKTEVCKFKFGFLAVVILSSFSPALFSQTFTDRVRDVRSFKAEKPLSLEIDNKYGKVHVIPWMKDSVRIEAEMLVGSNNLARMEKTKNSIRFDFTSTSYYIRAKTNFGTGGNQFLSELRGLSGTFIPGTSSVEINYTIHCPENINLSIINRFGNIYIDDLRGDLKLSLSNGDLKINSHEGTAQIEINFGTAIINQIADARLSVSYSDLLVRNAGQLVADTKSSTLNINSCEVLRTVSKRDKYFLTDISSLTVDGLFSQFWVESLDYELDGLLKFGNLNISKVRKDFRHIQMNSEFADISIGFESDADYEADIFYPAEATVSIPRRFGDGNEKTIHPSNNQISYRTAATEKLPIVRINALQKCFINLRD